MTGLTIRLATSRRDVHVTRQVEDLQFRKVVPGGYASASIQLYRPLNVTPDELAYFGKLYVYDARNGTTQFEGRIENLGRGADANGQVWQIDAVGSMAHAQDQTKPLMYQDLDLANWRVNPDAPVWMDAQQINTSVYGAGLQMHVPRGTVIAAPSTVLSFPGWKYTGMTDTGLDVAVVTFHRGEDTTDANWTWSMNGSTFGSVERAFVAGSSASEVLSSISHPGQSVNLYLNRYTSGITVADDLTAASFTNITVRSMMVDRTGASITTPSFYTSTQMTSTHVVADLLGRMLPLFDGVNATIDTTTEYGFAEQLSYPDGATAAQVLADLMTLIPSYYWAAWDSNPATGKARFEWRPWPTTVRYDATAKDGINLPSTASGVYNSVAVRYVDQTGNTHNITRTLANPILTAAGLNRSTRIDLGTNLAGPIAAQHAGDNFLGQNAVPPAAGTLNISRPVYDRLTCRMVQPWEIDPGYLIRVRDIAPTSFGDGDRDGTSTFRIVATNYAQATNTAALELDAPAMNLVNRVAGLPVRTTRF